MTPQEVRDSFVQSLAENAYLNMCTTQEMYIVISALEKQIPKIPLYHCDQDLCYDGIGCVEGEQLYEYYECPNCGWREETEVFENFKFKYCPSCGQALDWLEDTE
jgi:hypothetical protein